MLRDRAARCLLVHRKKTKTLTRHLQYYTKNFGILRGIQVGVGKKHTKKTNVWNRTGGEAQAVQEPSPLQYLCETTFD